MRIKDIMSADVVSVAPESKVTEVAEMIFDNGFHGLPVVKDGKVAGIITENDFFIKDPGTIFLPSYVNFLKEATIADNLPADRKKKIKKLLNLEARDIMTPDPITVRPEMEVSELLEFIKKTRFNTLPVTDEEKNLLGIVTLVDVIGMVKQNRAEKTEHKIREVDDLTRNVHSWWGQTFVFIKKTRLLSWKFIFVASFAAGAVATVAWMVSTKIQIQSGAAEKSARIYLAADDAEIGEGQLFNVDVMMDTDGQKSYSASLVINYDPREFALEIWDTSGSIFPLPDDCQFEKKPCRDIKNNPEKGQISIYLANPSGVTAKKEKIANLVFRTRRSAIETFPVSRDISIDFSSSGIYFKKNWLSGYKNKESENILTSVSGVNINVIHPPKQQ